VTLEVLVRRLEKGKQAPPKGAIEGYPELAAQFFGLKQV